MSHYSHWNEQQCINISFSDWVRVCFLPLVDTEADTNISYLVLINQGHHRIISFSLHCGNEEYTRVLTHLCSEALSLLFKWVGLQLRAGFVSLWKCFSVQLTVKYFLLFSLHQHSWLSRTNWLRCAHLLLFFPSPSQCLLQSWLLLYCASNELLMLMLCCMFKIGRCYSWSSWYIHRAKFEVCFDLIALINREISPDCCHFLLSVC